MIYIIFILCKIDDLKMPIKKRGLHRNKGRGAYLKGNRIVLESTKSKIAFFGILFLFGVVIVLAGMEVLQGR